MAANTTAISFYRIPSGTVAIPSEKAARGSARRFFAKLAGALLVGALLSFSVLEAVVVGQAVLGPVFDGALNLLSRPVLPVGF
jgi:hypothetical protein